MKKFKKNIVSMLLISSLAHNTFCTEFKFSAETGKASLAGAISGAILGFTLFKGIEFLDKWYISSKEIEGAYFQTDADLPKRVDLDFKSLSPNFDKQDDQILNDQHASLLHKLINNGKTSKFLDFDTGRIIPKIHYFEPKLTRRKSYNGICGSFVVGGAMVGAYIVGNVVQN